MPHLAYVGIGSNLGDKIDQCQKAISEILAIHGHRLIAQSSFYKTRPVGFLAQDWFINGVIQIETNLEPLELLRKLKEIERKMGRKETVRWGPRLIDLDLLLYDDLEMKTEELEIPHPRLKERQFVLIPLVEISPNLIHPTFKKTMKELLLEIQEDQGVQRIEKKFDNSEDIRYVKIKI